jgi:hypothetical protein
VASGEKLPCTGMCVGMLLWLQEELFVIDFFLLPMDVCEVVLGTQWLRTLGPIWWDFERLQMNFSWKGRRLDLRGLKPHVHRVVDNRVLGRELKRRKIGWLCHIMPTSQWVPTEGTLQTITLGAQQSGPSSIENQLLDLLNAYLELFNEPQGLPPNRSHDHTIQLKEGAGPIKVRSYRYPHYQKNEIEKMVT